MGLKLCSLSSGSKGNAILVSSARTTVLIDMGITFADFTRRLQCAGLAPSRFDALLVTHAHSDHVRGVDQFVKKTYAPVYASTRAWDGLDARLSLPLSARCAFDGSFSVGDIGVHPFDTPHDSPHSKGFCLVSGGTKVSVVTDLGHMTRNIFSLIADSDLVLLESNYDERMLRTGPYPEFLKRRIAGERGHLSNADSGLIASELAKRGVRKLVLGHLSEINNTPDLAYAACCGSLSDNFIEPGEDVSVEVAGQYAPTKIFEVETCNT